LNCRSAVTVIRLVVGVLVWLLLGPRRSIVFLRGVFARNRPRRCRPRAWSSRGPGQPRGRPPSAFPFGYWQQISPHGVFGPSTAATPLIAVYCFYSFPNAVRTAFLAGGPASFDFDWAIAYAVTGPAVRLLRPCASTSFRRPTRTAQSARTSWRLRRAELAMDVGAITSAPAGRPFAIAWSLERHALRQPHAPTPIRSVLALAHACPGVRADPHRASQVAARYCCITPARALPPTPPCQKRPWNAVVAPPRPFKTLYCYDARFGRAPS